MSSTKPPGIDRLAQLNALHLYGMATAWSELLAEGPRRPVQPEAWLDRLIEAELADRQVRSLRYQLKAARFPVHRDLTGIDWTETPLPHAQIEQLASAAFMETAHNLILVGGTGTGKTQVSIALPGLMPRGSQRRSRLRRGDRGSDPVPGMPGTGSMVPTRTRPVRVRRP
jgi:DNA replication protein DnaC